jgi:hypothetical protein
LHLGSPDGSNYHTTPLVAGTLDFSADPNAITVVVEGVFGFIVQARPVDTDDTGGGDDTVTAVVRLREDGVNL